MYLKILNICLFHMVKIKKLSVGVSEFLSNYNTSVIVYLTESEYNYDDKTKAKISVYEKKIT